MASQRGLRRLQALSTLSNASAALVPQLVALVSLDAVEYGAFSAVYLVFALGTSVALSAVAEAAVRSSTASGGDVDWESYSNTAGALAVVFGLIAVGVAAAVSTPQALVGAGLAVCASTYRVPIRYHEVRAGMLGKAVLADVLTVVVTLAAFAALVLSGLGRNAGVALTAWALGGLAAAFVHVRLNWSMFGQFVRWFRTEREHITPLLSESLLMDLGSIGTPFVLLPGLGISAFGVYRGVSNVAAPVRLVLGPLRPIMATRSTRSLISPRTLSLVVAASAVMGVLAAVALLLIEASGLALGVLSQLAPFAVPVGMFVAATTASMYVYIVARLSPYATGMLTARIAQTVFATALPLVGNVVGGLSGAIWGLTVSTVAAFVIWLPVARSGVSAAAGQRAGAE